jgi:hypothetical protein
MSDLVRSNECWSFSIAFDVATIQGRSLLDVRLRLLVGGRIENLHLLAIPLRESHTVLCETRTRVPNLTSITLCR